MAKYLNPETPEERTARIAAKAAADAVAAACMKLQKGYKSDSKGDDDEEPNAQTKYLMKAIAGK